MPKLNILKPLLSLTILALLLVPFSLTKNIGNNTNPPVSEGFKNKPITPHAEILAEENEKEIIPEETPEEEIETPTPEPTPPSKPVVKTTPKVTPPAPNPPPPPPPLTSSCPISTQSCVPCHKSETYCRVEVGEEYGYLGWACQNNNPANILAASDNPASDFKNTMIVNNGGTASCGVRYDARGYKYMIFPSYSAGIGSVKAYIKGINNGQHSAYGSCGNCTLAFFFGKFAGSTTYVNSIVAKMGGDVTSETLLSWVVANRLDDMVNAIKQTEGFFTQ